MKRIRLSALLIIGWAMASALPLNAQGPDKIAGMDRFGELTANVNVRAEPDISGALISGLPKSTRVHIWQERQGWLQVSSQSATHPASGWVFGKFVRQTTTPVQSVPMPPPALPVAIAAPLTQASPVESQIRTEPPTEQTSLPDNPSPPSRAADPALVAPPVLPIAATPPTSASPAPVSARKQPAVSPPTPERSAGTAFRQPGIGQWFSHGVMLMASFLTFWLAIGVYRRRSVPENASADPQRVPGQYI